MKRLITLALTDLNAARRLELVALIATIPAFYMAAVSVYRPLWVALYMMAFVVTSSVMWEARRANESAVPVRRHPATHHLAGLLACLLLLSVLLPEGDAADVLGTRLATAVLAVLRVAQSLWPAASQGAWRGALARVLALAIAVLGLCGLGFWWLEPGAKTFGDGLWLAFTTAATVGYGDIVPTTPASKIFAVFVVLMGFAALSLVTAAIAALWVQSEEQRIEQEILADLHGELKALRRDVAALRHEVNQRHNSVDGRP
jgi:voltage-gated potassium channel